MLKALFMKIHCFIFLLLAGTFTVSCSHTPSKHIIGAVETVQVQGLDYLARIDTGADTTSINAYNMTVENQEPSLTANIGKQLRFTTANEKGETNTIETKIVKVDSVRIYSSDNVEARYVVQLPITWGEHVKTVEVNLRDRSNMQFALLIGRNWLKDDFVVDVSDEEQRLEEKNNYIQQLLPRILTQ
jgi:hypothetical protein